MRSKPYEAQYLKEAQGDLDSRAQRLQEILDRIKSQQKKKRGLLSKILGWFS